MPMTVIVTRDVVPRFRGFLASVMLEIAPGVYTAPDMSKAVRARVWEVLEAWYYELGGSSILMTWADKNQPGGQGILTLGSPARELVETETLMLVRREVR